MLSHRYGTVCLPTRIVKTEFEKLKNEINKMQIDVTFSYKFKEESIEIENIMEYCYELDNNEDPARYRLKYLYKIFPKINRKVILSFKEFKLFFFSNWIIIGSRF